MANMFKKVVQMADLALDSYISELKKAQQNVTDNRPPFLPMRESYETDPDLERSQYGYKPKLALIPDETKRIMSIKDPIVAAIHQVRAHQMASFSRPQKDKYSPGFIVRRKDVSQDLSDEEKEQDDQIIEQITNFILNCGIIDEDRESANELMDFETFLKLIIKDRLTFDTVAIELVPDKKNNLHHFLPVSSSSIRFAAKNLTLSSLQDQQYNERFEREKFEAGLYQYVQVIKGRIRKAFTKEEIIFKFGNPVNDLFTNGYSIGELDLLISTVSAHLYAEKYNRSIFTHGFNTKGILNLKGEVEDEQIQALRRSWYAQGVGYDAMFRTPIINTPEGVEWIPLRASNQDMEFMQYMDYLIKIACAIYLIAPEEINFSSNRALSGGSSSVNYSNIEKRLYISRDRGLRPLLRFVENIINENILSRINPTLKDKFEFRFVGLDAESKTDEVSRQEKEVKIFRTVNEVRQEQGLDPIEGCDIILDPQFMQWFNQYSEVAQKFREEQQQMMGDSYQDLTNEVEGMKEEDNSYQDLQSTVQEMSKSVKNVKHNNKVPELIKIEVYKKNN